jgi:hypothetical protein
MNAGNAPHHTIATKSDLGWVRPTTKRSGRAKLGLMAQTFADELSTFYYLQ